MADTGAPYFIPYVEPTDLVRDYPAADEASADAIAAALDAAGGLVAVRSVVKTDTFTASSVTSGVGIAVPGLVIEHAVATAGNKLLFLVHLAGNTDSTNNGIGPVVFDGSTALTRGNADGNRPTVLIGGSSAPAATNMIGSFTANFLYEPPDTTTRTYTVRAVPTSSAAVRTVFVNRTPADSNTGDHTRSTSGLTLLEVKV